MPRELDATRNSRRRLDRFLLVLGSTTLALVVALTMLTAADRGDALTRNTIRLSLAWYFSALLIMSSMQPNDWATLTPRGRLARWCWTWGLVAYLVHVAMAFHYFHHWSHARALEATREQSGWGEGIYVNYAFTLVWLADAAWWWIGPQSYAGRSRRLHVIIHAFLLFIAFNATVVFADGPIRWIGAAAMMSLTFAWVVSRRRNKLAVQATGV